LNESRDNNLMPPQPSNSENFAEPRFSREKFLADKKQPKENTGPNIATTSNFDAMT
jgi:hypothetical protein